MGGILLILIVAGGVLCWPVTVRRSVNYRVTAFKVPFYLKALAFLHRHYEYRELVKTLVGGIPDRETQIMTLFRWTREHIRPIPPGFPVMDDHTWDTIVRGYGAQDQAADVFATLCLYAGIPAHFRFIEVSHTSKNLGVAFVQLENGGFGIFDPSHGVAIHHPDGRLATIEEVRADPSLVAQSTPPGLTLRGYPYRSYFSDLPAVTADDVSKTTRQVPRRRLLELLMRK